MKNLAFALVLALAVCSWAVSASPCLIIDAPHNNDPAGQTFTMHGTALDSDAVHVWAFPSTGAVFFGAAYPSGVDTTRQLPAGRWSLRVENAPIGTYPVVAYAHDPLTGGFPSQHGIMLEVRACVMYTVNWFFFGPGGQEIVPKPFCGVV